jgi:hypothetical protein
MRRPQRCVRSSLLVPSATGSFMPATSAIGPFCERERVMPSTFVAICFSAVLTLGVAVAACNARRDVQCEQDANCDLSGGGLCLKVLATQHQWCAYPDSACTDGYRYSDLDVGDDVSGACADGATFKLTVMVGGSGAGTVSSVPEGITCAAGTCTGSFLRGTQVQLSALATSGTFLGWSEACHGATSCAVKMDQDRSVVALFGTPGQALWVQQFGNDGEDVGHALAVDSDSNLIAVGGFTGTVTFDGAGLTAAGGSDIYVAKLSSSTGQVIWAKRFGGTSDDFGLAVALDSSNNVYIAGTFQGAIDFGGGAIQSAGGSDAFVLKLTSDGDYAWVNQIGGPGFDLATALSVRNNRVAVAGSFRNSMVVNGTTFTSSGDRDAFVAKLTTDGAYSWIREFGSADLDSATAVAIDSIGNVVIAGLFFDSVNFGGGQLTSAGDSDVFLLKLAADSGAHLFSKRFGSDSADTANALVLDAADNIYMTGAFFGTVPFGGPTPLTATNAGDVFLAKYSLAGAYVWATSFGGTGNELANSASVNSNGDIAIAGDFCGTLSFGGKPLTSASDCPNTDIFAARFSGSDGAHINSMHAGGTGTEGALGVAQTNDGRFFVTGGFQGFAEFGGRALTSLGDFDAYVLGLAPL